MDAPRRRSEGYRPSLNDVGCVAVLNEGDDRYSYQEAERRSVLWSIADSVTSRPPLFVQSTSQHYGDTSTIQYLKSVGILRSIEHSLSC